jgi:pimeloyl-ACP methyl ester carboxylesterase
MPRCNLSKFAFYPLCLIVMTGLGGSMLVGCAPFASVAVVIPSSPLALAVDQSNEELKQARLEMKAGQELAKSDPTAAMAQSEAAAMLSLDAQKNLSGRRAEEVIAFYNYAVAMPYTLSSALFRRYLAAIYEKYPDTPNAILIGHSMGGLIADVMIRDSAGSQYCDEVLGKPLDQFQIEPGQLKIIKESLIFKASTHVDEVIFIATPHKGSDLARNPIGRLGSRLVSLPAKLVAIGSGLVEKASVTNGKKVVARFPNSIDTLRPDARSIVAMNRLPIEPSVTYYSIIRDRGENNSPNSSDGVVAYRSSHLDGAESEKIVPYWHSYVHRSPETIAEVKRILLINDIKKE